MPLRLGWYLEAVLQGDESRERETTRNSLIHLGQDNPDKRRVITELADHLMRRRGGLFGGTIRVHGIASFPPPSEQPAPNLDVGRALELAIERWTDSTDGIHLRTQLILKRQRLVGVNKIVCFGTGGPSSWTTSRPSPQLERRGHGNLSLIRHAAAWWISDTIAMLNGHPVEVYSQDTSYRPQDIDGLREHGITPFSGHRGRHKGYLKIDAHTLVLIFGGADKDCLQVICATNRPAVIIARLMGHEDREEGARKTVEYLEAEYDKHANWVPFHHYLLHSTRGDRGPGTLADAIEGHRPLQGATVWFRKSQYNP